MREALRASAIALVLACALSSPSTAIAGVTLDMPDGAAKSLYQGWVDGSRMPTPNITVRLQLRDCDEDSMTCMAWIGGGVEIFFPDLAYLTGPQYDGHDLQMVHRKVCALIDGLA